MKYKQIKQLQNSELQSTLLDLQRELIKLNASVATGTAVKNPGQIKITKKSIARVYTEMRVREDKLHG
ncbi:MAG: large subunit ribosomal protein L29 [Candidatus Woesearchaeota archaeon]|jgi:large subunit ribosomal protein L29